MALRTYSPPQRELGTRADPERSSVEAMARDAFFVPDRRFPLIIERAFIASFPFLRSAGIAV
jgi:hypothetical protein